MAVYKRHAQVVNHVLLFCRERICVILIDSREVRVVKLILLIAYAHHAAL